MPHAFGNHRMGNDLHVLQMAAQFHHRPWHVVVGRDKDQRAVAVPARPVGGFDGVADGVERAPADIDAAFKQMRMAGLAHEGGHTGLGVDAGDEQALRPPFLQDGQCIDDAVRSAGQGRDPVHRLAELGLLTRQPVDEDQKSDVQHNRGRECQSGKERDNPAPPGPALPVLGHIGAETGRQGVIRAGWLARHRQLSTFVPVGSRRTQPCLPPAAIEHIQSSPRKLRNTVPRETTAVMAATRPAMTRIAA
jgi:hypothetical protein